MNVSNDLILFRMVLFPIFLVDLICDRMQLAFAFLPLAGATDVLDVFPVRLFKQHTLLGPYLGPLADKLLMTVSYASLAIICALPAWLAVIVTTKDLFVSIGVAIMYFSGQVVEAAPAFLGENRPLFFRSSLLRWPCCSRERITGGWAEASFLADGCCGDRLRWPLYLGWRALFAARPKLKISGVFG